MTENFIYPGKELELFSKAKNWKKYLAHFINPHIKGRVLEVGAGLGGMTSWMKHSDEHEWVLLEPDKKMAELLLKKKGNESINNKYSLINGTIDNAGYELFDTIIYIDVLEHIEDDNLEISKAAKLLTPGGKLIILSPAFQFLFNPFDKAIGHFRRYSKNSIRKANNRILKEESLHYLDSAGFFSSLANKLLLRQQYPAQKQLIFWDRFLIPVSFVLDRIFFYSFGKSILGVWKNETSVNIPGQTMY
ncbi:MAG: class I SAM-dependent methyltransferase [Bacteroidota bacterium]